MGYILWNLNIFFQKNIEWSGNDQFHTLNMECDYNLYVHLEYSSIDSYISWHLSGMERLKLSLNIQTHQFPLARIKKIMKSDPICKLSMWRLLEPPHRSYFHGSLVHDLLILANGRWWVLTLLYELIFFFSRSFSTKHRIVYSISKARI